MKILRSSGFLALRQWTRRGLKTALLLTLGLASAAAAVQSLWIGQPVGTWENEAKWQNSDASSAFPNNGGGKTFIVNTGGGGTTIGVNAPITVDGLTLATGAVGLNASGSLTIESSFTWSGTTTLSGPGPLTGKGATAISGPVTLLADFVNMGTCARRRRPAILSSPAGSTMTACSRWKPAA